MEKKGIWAIIVAIIVVGGGIGGYLIWNNLNQGTKPGLPTSTVPDATLTFINGASTQTLTLQEIVDAIDDGDLTLVESQMEEDSKTVTIKGVNPLELYDLMGWYYVDEVKFTGSDGYGKAIDAKTFVEGDPNFYKDAIETYTILVIAVNNQWLNQYNSEKGDFSLEGSNLASNQRIENIVNLTYVSDWNVDITVNEVIVASININNITNFSGANNTLYNWSYSDEESGKDWGPRNVNGTTIASMLGIAGISVGQDFNVSFVAVDGWAGKTTYNRTEIVDGYTGTYINEPPELLSNEGKQTVLSIEDDGKPIGHIEGPFRIIMPGNTRNSYSKWVVEIRFEV